jgi:hypothetical protein
MEYELTACSNCRCPINYDCIRFEVFYHGKYKDIFEFTHNNDYTCDEIVTKEDMKNSNDKRASLF